MATGAFTIPMMKKVGYRPHVAGAIEAAASTGGQLMPPIMGAGVARANPCARALPRGIWPRGFTSFPPSWLTSPWLGIGSAYELMHWQVGLAMLTPWLGLIAFASAIERYFIRQATGYETPLL